MEEINSDYENSILIIHNENSDKTTVSELKTPFLLTMEYYDFHKDFFIYTWIALNFIATKTFRISSPEHQNSKPHKHNFFEISYVMKGSCTHIIDDTKIRFCQGECIILNHHIKHLEKPDENCELISLELSDKFFKTIIENDYVVTSESSTARRSTKFYQEIIEELTSSKGEKKYWRFTPTVDSSIIKTQTEKKFTEMVTTINQKANGFYFHMQELIVQFFCLLLEPSMYQYNLYTMPPSKAEGIFVEVRRLLEETDGMISREELSKKMNYDDHHLNRIVQQTIGMSILEYARTFTMKKAAFLLTSTVMTTEEIINELGFSNKTYFFNIFKQTYGITPKQYRETFMTADDYEEALKNKR